MPFEAARLGRREEATSVIEALSDKPRADFLIALQIGLSLVGFVHLEMRQLNFFSGPDRNRSLLKHEEIAKPGPLRRLICPHLVCGPKIRSVAKGLLYAVIEVVPKAPDLGFDLNYGNQVSMMDNQ